MNIHDLEKNYGYEKNVGAADHIVIRRQKNICRRTEADKGIRFGSK